MKKPKSLGPKIARGFLKHVRRSCPHGTSDRQIKAFCRATQQFFGVRAKGANPSAQQHDELYALGQRINFDPMTPTV